MCVPYDKIILKAQHINLTFTWLPVWAFCKTLNTFDFNSSNVTHFFKYFHKLCADSSPVSQNINGWKLVFIKSWIISNNRFDQNHPNPECLPHIFWNPDKDGSDCYKIFALFILRTPSTISMRCLTSFLIDLYHFLLTSWTWSSQAVKNNGSLPRNSSLLYNGGLTLKPAKRKFQ